MIIVCNMVADAADAAAVGGPNTRAYNYIPTYTVQSFFSILLALEHILIVLLYTRPSILI